MFYASARYEAIFSMPTKELDVVDPIDYMKMYNQALLARNPLAIPKYSVERINRTASGKYPSWVYPANDWYKIMFKNYNTNHHVGVNIRGGGKVIQYYASVNYNRDMGMLKTDKLNDFDCNITNNQTSFRTNLNIDLKAGIKLVINSSTTIDKYHGPLTSVTQAYIGIHASPVVSPHFILGMTLIIGLIYVSGLPNPRNKSILTCNYIKGIWKEHATPQRIEQNIFTISPAF